MPAEAFFTFINAQVLKLKPFFGYIKSLFVYVHITLENA